MDGGPSKINPLNSHPSNPIHRAAQKKDSPTTPTTSSPPDLAPLKITEVLLIVRAVLLTGLLNGSVNG